jgi:hypothetical protein
MRTKIAALALLSLVGCSSVPKPSVKEAAVLDTVSTAIVLEAVPGTVEMNPLGFAGATALKIPVIMYIEGMEEGKQKEKVKNIASSIWTAAAVNNFALLVLNPTQSIILGIVSFYYLITNEN